MKKLIALLLCMTMILALAACGGTKAEAPAAAPAAEGEAPAEAAAPTYEWKLNTPMPIGSAISNYGETFAAKVAELSGGRMKITVYGNEQLAGGGGGSEAVQMAQQGLIDFDIHNGTMWQGYDARTDIPCSPWLFRSEEQVAAAIDKGLLDELSGVYNGFGMKPLGFGQCGWTNWASRDKHFDSMDSMVGVKMRTPNESYGAAFSALGMNTAYMTSNEVVTGLQQGVLDAAPYMVMFLAAQNVAEVAPYITDNHFAYDFVTLVTNNKLFESLSPEDQAILVEAGEYAAEWFTETMKTENQRFLDEMVEKYNAEIYEMPAELEDEIFENLKDAYKARVETIQNADKLWEICGVDMAWVNS